MAKTQFIDENPSTGQAGTMLLAAWFNKVFGQNGHVHDGLDADGSAPVIHYPTRVTMADTTLNKNTDCILYVNCTAGDRHIALCPVADVPAGRPLLVMKTDITANVAIITDPDGKTINGAASFQLSAPYEGVWLAHDNTNWFIISRTGG